MSSLLLLCITVLEMGVGIEACFWGVMLMLCEEATGWDGSLWSFWFASGCGTSALSEGG